MTRNTFSGDETSSKKVTALPPMKLLVVVSGLIFIVCTKPIDAIGSWGKKAAATESEHVNDLSVNSDMEKTYLDLFGESAKEFLTQKAPEKFKAFFPSTDEECRWDWRYIRCEPYCDCSFQPKFPGDFHLGRTCRNRSHIRNESIGDKTPFEEADDIYREYCLIEKNGAMERYHETSLTPPPPSIPSPFPFLLNSGKVTWKILRTKTDPVVEKAMDEFELFHGRVRSLVCKDLRHRCGDDESDGSRVNDFSNSSESIEFAWQERLFCRDVVKECTASTLTQEQKAHDRNSPI